MFDDPKTGAKEINPGILYRRTESAKVIPSSLHFHPIHISLPSPSARLPASPRLLPNPFQISLQVTTYVPRLVCFDLSGALGSFTDLGTFHPDLALQASVSSTLQSASGSAQSFAGMTWNARLPSHKEEEEEEEDEEADEDRGSDIKGMSKPKPKPKPKSKAKPSGLASAFGGSLAWYPFFFGCSLLCPSSVVID